MRQSSAIIQISLLVLTLAACQASGYSDIESADQPGEGGAWMAAGGSASASSDGGGGSVSGEDADRAAIGGWGY